MFEQSLGMRLRGAYLSFHRKANAHFARFGVTADQFVVLTLLAEAEGMTQRELGQRACSDPNTISAIVARLELKTLVRREAPPDDARARCVYLTPEGRKLQHRLYEGSRSLRGGLDGLFQGEERELIKDLLARIPAGLAGDPNGRTKVG